MTGLAGRLAVPRGAARSLPALTVRVGSADGRPLAEGTTSPDGLFALEVPVAPGAAAVVLQLVDGDGEMLAEDRAVALGAPGELRGVTLRVTDAALARAVPVPAPGGLPELVPEDRLSLLRTRVDELAAAGQLPADAAETLAAGVHPLRWAGDLIADAARVLQGDGAAAERLRLALLGLGTTAEPVPSAGHLPPPAAPRPGREAVAALAAAAVWAADGTAEAQAMLNGLAAVLWSRPWLEALLDLAGADGGEPAALRTLMGGPGPGGIPNLPGLPPIPIPVPVPVPGGGVPGLPKGPGWPWIPPKRPPIEIDPRIPGGLGLEVPTHQEQCLIGAIVAAKRAADQAPRWDIAALSDPFACPGALLTLTGSGFGAAGVVRFTAGDGQVTAPDVPRWTDTEIRVRVPPGASPGPITLRILERTLVLCGRLWHVHRLGASRVPFGGGLPAIVRFRVDGGDGPQVIVTPETDVGIQLETSAGGGVTAEVSVWDGATRIFHVASAGGAHSLTFRTPAATVPLDLRVEAGAGNGCGTVTRVITAVVARQPDLRILQMEATQAIQRLDDSVPLAARRRTVLRAWLDSGLRRFSFVPGEQNALPGVTATLTILRGGVPVAVVAPDTSPFTVQVVFFPYARESTDRSLEFVLPSEHLVGDVTLQLRVEVSAPPHGVEPGVHTTDLRHLPLRFEPTRGLSLVRILIADDWRGLPAPSTGEWQAALQGARTRFPVPDDGWEVRLLAGYQVITSDNDLSIDEGWDDLLEDLDDVAGDATDSWDHRWVGLLPAFRMGIDTFTMRGMGRTKTTDRPWPLANDYLVMAALAGRPEVFAHELGHTFGFDHAGCPPGGPGKPDDIDYSLPLYTDEIGFDTFTMTPFPAGSPGELMSYCAANGLWPSILTWTRMLDRLK